MKYGKLSVLFLVLAYVAVPIVLFIGGDMPSLLVTWLPDDFFVSGLRENVLVLLLVLSILSAVASIMFGHYSKLVKEGHGMRLNFSIGFGYAYFFILVVIVYLG